MIQQCVVLKNTMVKVLRKLRLNLEFSRGTLLTLARLGDKSVVDVGEDTTLRNGDTSQELVQFLIVADGQLDVAGDDTVLVVITSSVSSQFQNFGGQVFQDSGQIDGGTSTDTAGIAASAQVAVDTADGELESSTAGSRFRLLVSGGSFLACHCKTKFEMARSARGVRALGN